LHRYDAMLNRWPGRIAARCRSGVVETDGSSPAWRYIAWAGLRILAAVEEMLPAGHARRPAPLNSPAGGETKLTALSQVGAVRSIQVGAVHVNWMLRGRVAIQVACVAFGSGGHFGFSPAWANDVGGRQCLEAVPPSSKPTYPLKASANNRYLVDQDNVPFLMVGDAPQTLIAKPSLDDAALYVTNRRHHGINTLWINLLCNAIEDCRVDGATADGISPFVVADDLGTPNPAYFRRVDEVLKIAAGSGMVVLLDPIETGGWLSVLRANGVAKAFAYGQYLGRRYRDFANIIWMHGNDFQSWHDPIDDELVQAVARGILSTDPRHIHTAELNYPTSGTLDDPTWEPFIGLDAAYTYFPTYAQVLTEYNRPNFKPVFLVEANYEFEHLPFTDGGTIQNLRRQEYWALLSGAAGQIYGSAYTWRLPDGWQRQLDSPGAQQLAYLTDLFLAHRWYDLIPDERHTVVTAGYGQVAGYIGKLYAHVGRLSGRAQRALDVFKRHTGLGSVTTNTYAAAASTPDGCLVIVYLPTIRAITVDMSKLA
jgi:Protein of unknown function (DUF4038)